MSDPTDPADTPHLHQVLYTNDVIRVVSTILSGLFTVASPERVRAALQHILDNWPMHLAIFEQLKRVADMRESAERSNPTGSGN
jgi:demethoxyubiquinone hydroxylase (CLK1/Coq7/Cat5 family)